MTFSTVLTSWKARGITHRQLVNFIDISFTYLCVMPAKSAQVICTMSYK